LAEKIIRKVLRASIVRENWRKILKAGGKEFYYRCEAEIKNTGVSNLYNLIVIAALYNPQEKKVITVVNSRLQTVKLAGYMVIDTLKPDENFNVDIHVGIPALKDILNGKRKIKNLEKHLEDKKIIHKVFVLYDTAKYDQKVKKWFQDKGAQKIKIVKKEWQLKRMRHSPQASVVSKGIIRNTGTTDLKNFEIVSILIDLETGSPLRWIIENPIDNYYDNVAPETEDNEADKENYIELSGTQKFDLLPQSKTAQFNIFFDIPEDRILKQHGWSLKKIENAIKEGKIIHKIFVNYEKKKEEKATYKNLKDQLAVIQEVRGTKKVEIVEQNWNLIRDKEVFYKCNGKIKNTGSLDVEDLYVIGSLYNVENKKPVTWGETKSESGKAAEIISIKYLSSGQEIDFELAINLPKTNVKTTEGWTNEDIINNFNSGNLKADIELYFTHEDVLEEGMKRLNLGNTYFHLGNYKAALIEYEEGIKLLPKDKRFYLNCAIVYYKTGLYLESLRMLEKCIKRDKRYSKAYYFQGLVYNILKSPKKSMNSFRKAMSLDTDNAKIPFNVSCIYFKRGLNNEGIRWLKRAFKIDPNLIINQSLRDNDLKEFRKTEQFQEIVDEVRDTVLEETE